ncbi:TPA: hypothetical protein QHZ12_004740 [Escherichia coli]|nr:hypothetical protein [Escherichia coli]
MTSVQVAKFSKPLHKLLNLFGDDPWYADWPTVPNPKYQYLERIVNAVREGLKELDKLEAS